LITAGRLTGISPASVVAVPSPWVAPQVVHLDLPALAVAVGLRDPLLFRGGEAGEAALDDAHARGITLRPQCELDERRVAFDQLDPVG
jgi:hypothetical protein